MPDEPITDDDLEDDWKLVRPSFTGGHGHTRQLKGKFFGFLEVVERAPSDKHGASCWSCVCRRCGNPKIVTRAALLSGRVKSCGCLKESLKGKPKPKPVDPAKAPKKTKKSTWSRLLDEEG